MEYSLSTHPMDAKKVEQMTHMTFLSKWSEKPGCTELITQPSVRTTKPTQRWKPNGRRKAMYHMPVLKTMLVWHHTPKLAILTLAKQMNINVLLTAKATATGTKDFVVAHMRDLHGHSPGLQIDKARSDTINFKSSTNNTMHAGSTKE